MKSRASIQNDVTRLKDMIAGAPTQEALAAIVRRHDFVALPEASKKALQEVVNDRWRKVGR